MAQPGGAESAAVFVVMGLTGAGLVWLGRHVRRTEDLTLVAGARGATVTDPAGLTALVGRTTVVVGLATILVGLLYPLVGAPERGLLWGGYIVGTLALAGWTHWKTARYTA